MWWTVRSPGALAMLGVNQVTLNYWGGGRWSGCRGPSTRSTGRSWLDSKTYQERGEKLQRNEKSPNHIILLGMVQELVSCSMCPAHIRSHITLGLSLEIFNEFNEFWQTWKKARTRGHCPRKFLRIVEIFWLWKIMHLYFQKKTNFLWKCLMKHLIFGIFIAYKWWFPQ